MNLQIVHNKTMVEFKMCADFMKPTNMDKIISYIKLDDLETVKSLYNQDVDSSYISILLYQLAQLAMLEQPVREPSDIYKWFMMFTDVPFYCDDVIISKLLYCTPTGKIITWLASNIQHISTSNLHALWHYAIDKNKVNLVKTIIDLCYEHNITERIVYVAKESHITHSLYQSPNLDVAIVHLLMTKIYVCMPSWFLPDTMKMYKKFLIIF
jgi:hypothetical protein